jgi:polyphosphate kinase
MTATPEPGRKVDETVAEEVQERFLNRDLQWLEFNDRVLHMGADQDTPLLERVRFLGIFLSNLDEFFMKRVGGLKRRIDAGAGALTGETDSPATLLRKIRDRVEGLLEWQQTCYREKLIPELQANGIHIVGWDDLDENDRKEAEDWYYRNVFPILTPLAVDPGHRFPFISNMSVSLGVMLSRPGETEQLFARVKVPEVPSRLYRFEGTSRLIPVREIVENNLDDLFPGMQIIKVLPFRVTRNADIENENEDAEDLLAQIQQQLRERRFAKVVRLEIVSGADRQMLQLLCDELNLDDEDVYETRGLTDYGILNEIADLPRSDLRYESWKPTTPRGIDLDEPDLFSLIRSDDILVHHPYESFDATVEQFVEQAAADPKVLCIKQTLYRTSGDSPFIPNLIRAAESGKQVAVLVELRARFDEARNIIWARKLEDAGVHVAYGVVGLKTHTKTVLVIRQEGNGIRSYAHIGTGNYNSKTAALYEDVGLFTCNEGVNADLVSLFNYMTGRSRQRDYEKLLVAPVAMKRRFIELIEREALLHTPERPGRIIAKMNQIEDRSVTEALYKASQAGVKIDLVVRGFCSLRPGVPGLSENIRVISIVGRFLEHSRIFWFSAGRENPLEGDFYIGSADWMYRNLHSRVEAVVPVEGHAQRARLWEILQINIEDRVQAWDMQPDGSYVLRSIDGEPDPEVPSTLGTHRLLMDRTLERLQIPDINP